MYGASAVFPMISAVEWFSIMMKKMWLGGAVVGVGVTVAVAVGVFALGCVGVFALGCEELESLPQPTRLSDTKAIASTAMIGDT